MDGLVPRRDRARGPSGRWPGRVSSRRRCLPLLAFFATVGLGPAGARAADDEVWRSLADPVFRPVAPNADLPESLIPISMTEGPSGFLWLGGDEALLRWDGYQFREYPGQPKLPDGVSEPASSTLHLDARKILWVGTKSNGLARFDPQLDRLVCVPLAKPAADKAAARPCGKEHVWSIDDDGAGGLWIGSDGGLFRLKDDGNVIGRWNFRTAQSDGAVLAVLHDKDGVLWVGTAGGLVRSGDAAGTFRPVQLPVRSPAKPNQEAKPPAVSRLLQDKAGRLWIGTRQDGAFVIDRDGGPAREVPTTDIQGTEGKIAGSTSAPEITALLEIAPNRIWLATDGRGIVEATLTGGAIRTQRIVHNPVVPFGLDGNSVQSLYRDSSGLVWIGTDAGLSQYTPDPDITTLFGYDGRTPGVPGDSASSVLATADGSVWVGLQGEGYAVFDAKGHRTTGLPGRRVYALAPAPGGGVLLGTDGGLYRADATGRKLTLLVIPGQSPSADVRSLEVLDGAIWVGGRDNGLWQLQLAADGQVSLRWQDPAATALTNANVEALAAMPDGRLAVGTFSGLNIIDPSSHGVEQIRPSATPHGLDEGLITAFATDHHGRLWVGTEHGIDVLEDANPKVPPRFHRIGLADGLSNAGINGLVVDRQGRVWASTNNGLAVIDPEKLTVHALQRADGVAITNYWAGAATITRDGNLLFGGVGGVTLVRPGARGFEYRPPVVFTAARIGGQPVSLGGLSAGPLVVPPDANNLEVEFAALDYSAPALNLYRYRLEGFDSDWTDTDAAHRVAAYTNLPPGSYTLRLRGSNRDHVWTNEETMLQVEVLPAWYQTLWFRLAATAAGVLVVAALLRGWTAILRRRQRELERQVADRTGELSVSKRQLEHANAVLELRVAERTQALVERTAALEASEARFRAWFNNAEDAVFVVQVEPDGRFVYEAVNAAVERMFGIPAAAYPGRRPETVLSPEYAAGVLARYREAAKGAPIQFETRLPQPGGDRLVDTWIVPLRHPVSGRVERLVGASRDMTERRALEARLAQAQKLQALGGLAGGIAHDFNNILQAVAGAATLIEQRPEDHEKTTRLARSTIAAAERGTSIARRLLAFARSDELRVEAMPTAEVLEGLSEVLTYALGRTITVRTEFADALPPLLADRGQLETALVNVGTNARDAMPRGGVLTLAAQAEIVPEGAVHPAGLAPGRYVRIDVSDTGCGMDPVTLTRAVEPFFTTKPPGQGTGLGLALVKGFTEQSGGGMAIESTPAVGTTVRLWLRQAAANPVQAPATKAGDRHQGIAPARILVVDDDDLVRETMAEQLACSGFNVVAAASGAEALAAIQAKGPPDALVCDLSMPGMNGIDTIKRARDLLPDLPCFLLTGYAGERGALESGNSFTLLRKPISASALIAQIDAGLASGRR